MKLIVSTALLLLAGCGSNSGVVREGPDTFKIYKRGASGFSGSEAVKSDVMLQASKYCANQNKSVHVVGVIMGSPPYIMGNFPKAEVRFKCLDEKELSLVRATERASDDAARKTGSVPDSPDIYTELKKLKGLLDEGIITQAEFDAKKKQILAK